MFLTSGVTNEEGALRYCSHSHGLHGPLAIHNAVRQQLVQIRTLSLLSVYDH
ncbi:hypothetical protein J6590_017198 [Homalodisca vitripennis]|nr:hypothetical protein J6590_017198 [Homalodisca vitripennis]